MSHSRFSREEIAQQEEPAPRYLVRGKYQNGQMFTLEDFAEAEWRGDQEAGNW